MLSFQVSAFGPIRHANVRLRPLTIFVGPNNSGKSYMAMLIYSILRATNWALPPFITNDPTFRRRHTIRTQLRIGRARRRRPCRRGADRDHVADLERVRPYDNAVDQQLQDRLFLLKCD